MEIKNLFWATIGFSVVAFFVMVYHTQISVPGGFLDPRYYIQQQIISYSKAQNPYNKDYIDLDETGFEYQRFLPYRLNTRAPIKILLWTKESEQGGIWGTYGLHRQHTIPSGQCEIECIITSDKKAIGEVQAVVFDPAMPLDNLDTASIVGDDIANEVYNYIRDPIVMPQKRPGQLWVNFGYYLAEHLPILNNPIFMSQYDINMTYDHCGNSRTEGITLFCNWLGQGDLVSNLKKAPPSKSSSGNQIIFIADDCWHGGARARASYIQQLMRYVNVDSYGSCLNNKPTPSGWETQTPSERYHTMIELISKYKFYLAFEDNNSTDYVTEKLMLGFLAGTVPVYMGAPNVHKWLPGDKSIIPTSEFANPKSLADALTRISKDNNEYNSYFNWKSQELAPEFQEKVRHCILNNTECRLCKKVAYVLENKQNLIYGTTNTAEDYALRFDGTTTYVEVGDYANLKLDEMYTINAWIYPDILGDFRIVDKNTGGKIDGYSLDVLKEENKGFLRLCASNLCTKGMATPLYPGNWYFVSVVLISTAASQQYDLDAGITLYVNGRLDYHVPFPVPMYGLKPTEKNNLPLRFGRAAEGNSIWKGLIDDVSIWHIPLSQERIRGLMFEQLGGQELGLAGYWSFNEGTGDQVKDSSPSKRHGTIHGAAIKWEKVEGKEMVLNPCF